VPVLRRWFDGTRVEFAVFRRVDRWYAPLQPSQFRRLHPKLVAVDGDLGFVGGINIVDDRFDVHHGATDTPRLDFAAEIRGPVVAAIDATLQALWRRATQGVPWREELHALAHGHEWVQRGRRSATRAACSAPSLRPNAWRWSCATTCAAAARSSRRMCARSTRRSSASI
jgi:cardiolipin synthase A/B